MIQSLWIGFCGMSAGQLINYMNSHDRGRTFVTCCKRKCAKESATVMRRRRDFFPCSFRGLLFKRRRTVGHLELSTKAKRVRGGGGGGGVWQLFKASYSKLMVASYTLM